MHNTILSIKTPGRCIIDITDEVQKTVETANVGNGLCNLFIQHTSASLMISENADPQVLKDLETFISDLVPDGDKRYGHTAEGPDDMSAHVRSLLTQTSMSIPIINGELALGTWQAIYLWEHRSGRFTRKIVVNALSSQ